MLHHGRGTDELDLLGLADVLDPRRRLHVVSPRAPLPLDGLTRLPLVPGAAGGLPRSGDVRLRLRARCCAASTTSSGSGTGIGPERTVLGGFSMGAVMSYALGLGAAGPVPAGMLAFSGFIPTRRRAGSPAWTQRQGLPVFIAHGSRDPVIDVGFAREAEQAAARGRPGGRPTTSSRARHHIDPRHLPLASAPGWSGASPRPPRAKAHKVVASA